MEEYTLDPNVVASALKLYLRELPDSLIPQKLASKFEAAAGIHHVTCINHLHVYTEVITY